MPVSATGPELSGGSVSIEVAVGEKIGRAGDRCQRCGLVVRKRREVNVDDHPEAAALRPEVAHVEARAVGGIDPSRISRFGGERARCGAAEARASPEAAAVRAAEQTRRAERGQDQRRPAVGGVERADLVPGLHGERAGRPERLAAVDALDQRRPRSRDGVDRARFVGRRGDRSDDVWHLGPGGAEVAAAPKASGRVVDLGEQGRGIAGRCDGQAGDVELVVAGEQLAPRGAAVGRTEDAL